ncbi:MAG: hypothetical protein U0350_07935 [Caldilineaceae bacterium]
MPVIPRKFLAFYAALAIFCLLLLSFAFFTKPIQAGVTPKRTNALTLCSNKTLLFVASNRPLLLRDEPLVTYLTSLGYTVVVRTDKEVLATDAVGKDLVIISESVLSTNVNTKLRDVAVPLITWEGWLLDDLRMTGPIAYADYGELLTETKIQIVNPSHPLAAGLSGVVQTIAINDQINNKFHWGVPSQAAQIVATPIGNPGYAYIFAYEAGAQMVGMVAPARRIFIPNATGNFLMPAGWAIFDAAVNWAINCSISSTATPTFSPTNTSAPSPSATPLNTPTPTNSPTATLPQATPTATPKPSATPTNTKTATTTPPAATPTPSNQSAHLIVTLTDFLFDDADHNNVVSSGDKLLYVISLKNDGAGPALSLRIDDTLDPNTTLIVGTVQANQGVVNQGNNPGDTQVSIAYGRLDPSGQTIISLQATINSSLRVSQVENQAVVTFANPNGGPGGQTVVLSDDPDTSDPGDATLTGLNGNQPQPRLKLFMPIVARPK